MAEDFAKLSSSEILESEIVKPDVTKEKMLKIYEEIARRNEFMLNYEEHYHGPRYIAETLSSLITKNRGSFKILDVAAGTGYVSEQLRIHGFSNIDGLDASEPMLELAKKKNLYENYICEYLTEKPLDIKEETYDAVVMCGALAPGALPCSAFHEMIRLLKRGGYCCFMAREKTLETSSDYADFEKIMDSIEQRGTWKVIEKKTYPNYHDDMKGRLFCYKKT